MNRTNRLSPAERVVEEIRAVRRRLWAESGATPSEVLRRLGEQRRKPKPAGSKRRRRLSRSR